MRFVWSFFPHRFLGEFLGFSFPWQSAERTGSLKELGWLKEEGGKRRKQGVNKMRNFHFPNIGPGFFRSCAPRNFFIFRTGLGKMARMPEKCEEASGLGRSAPIDLYYVLCIVVLSCQQLGLAVLVFVVCWLGLEWLLLQGQPTVHLGCLCVVRGLCLEP